MPGRDYIFREVGCTERTITVSEGDFVVELYVYKSQIGLQRQFRTIGPEPRIIDLGQQDCQPGYATSPMHLLLAVNDQQFAVVSKFTDRPEHTGRLKFQTSRQVHNGELRRRVPFHAPHIARELVSEHHPWQNSIDLNNGCINWAKLTEVASLTEQTPGRVLMAYWPFLITKWDKASHQPTVDMLFGRRQEQIHLQEVPNQFRHRYTKPKLKRFIESGEFNWNNYWVRYERAKAVLYMHHFKTDPSIFKELLI